MWEYNYSLLPDYLEHHGILGMRWGVRRYQNKDGTLTAKGRKRLGLEDYDKAHGEDFVVKKGTKASRVVTTNGYYDTEDTYGKKAAEKFVKDALAKDKKLETKYVSVDNVRNSGRKNGKDFYLSWFSGEGYDPEHAQLTMYQLKNDIKVASGKQVVDAVMSEIGQKKVKEIFKQKKDFKDVSMEYTTNKDLFNRVNQRFKDKGYDAVEDINDPDTDMPLIVFNTVKNFGNPTSVTRGEKAVREVFERYGYKVTY